MLTKNASIAKAFSSQYQEIREENLTIQGSVPVWLSGSFISNGPAQFESGSTALTHWFDGFAMLKKFDFQNGKVSFQNRFLQSDQYVESRAKGRLADNEFGTYASNSLLGRIYSSLKSVVKGSRYDNTNVNISRLGDHWLAMTETRDVLEFSRDNLDTLGSFHFEDDVSGQLMLAHPHMDFERGEMINVVTEFGREIKYHIVKIPRNSETREIIVTLSSKKAFYMHSFSITPNYIILMKSPLEMNKLKLMLGMPFNKTLSWSKTETSFFIIIDRRDASVQEIEVDPFLCLHTGNAFERGHELILDLVSYDGGNPYDFLYLSNLRLENPVFPHSTLRRYVLDLQKEKARKEVLVKENLEFPTLNYESHNGRPYEFLYTISMLGLGELFFNAIQKIQMQNGEIIRFAQENYYFGEALFVENPRRASEDDGVVLSLAFDRDRGSSSLFVLDGKKLELLAEIRLPLHLPMGLHGNFYAKSS